MHPDKQTAVINGVVELAKELDNANLIIDQMAVDLAAIIRENDALRESNASLVRENFELKEMTALTLDFPDIEGMLGELEDLPIIEGELDNSNDAAVTIPDFFMRENPETTEEVTCPQYTREVT